MRRSLWLLVIGACLAVGACGGKNTKDTAPVDTAGSANSGADTSGADDANAGAGAGTGEDTAGPMEGLLARRTIYFDFDSSEVRGEGTEIVAAHAKQLAGSPGMKVRLEGHTDERGSREYNIGLGERRAQAVRRALLLQGATETQLSTVSYGEERPAAASTDETGWAQNRRVEIVYTK